MTAPEQPAICRRLGCTTPGQQPSCQLCPHSPTYYGNSPEHAERQKAEQRRVEEQAD